MSEVKVSDSEQNVNVRYEKRDGEIYIALGLFISALALPVLLGTFFAAAENARGALINGICGGVLLAVGVGAIAYGYVLLQRNKRRT